MTKAEKLKHCDGCNENFYNGNNPLGVQECWSLETAKLIWRKRVPMDQRPPWTQKARRYFACRREKGAVFVGPDQVR